MSDKLKAVFVRTFRTAIQVFLASIASATVLSEVDWGLALSTVALASLIAFLTGILGSLPEVPETPETPNADGGNP